MLADLALAALVHFLPCPSLAPHVDYPLVVPRGRAILLDGRVGRTEWSDAVRVTLAGGVQLLLKHDDAFVYAAVTVPTPRAFGVNLYLAGANTASPYLNLHASAKLGEREGMGATWPEWRWWNNLAWAANVARYDGAEGRRFLPDAAKEFQIARARWPRDGARLSLDLELAAGTEHPVVTTHRADGRSWLSVRLAP